MGTALMVLVTTRVDALKTFKEGIAMNLCQVCAKPACLLGSFKNNSLSLSLSLSLSFSL